jgi:predicted O-methyltransferase YrrM
MFSGFSLGKKMFDVTLAFNNVKRVTAIQDDILNVNANTFGKVSFALLDVDLYYPISIFLPKLWEILSPGGLIVVDDCMQNNPYDGACQAYLEFIQNTNLEPDIRFSKLGIIQKPF